MNQIDHYRQAVKTEADRAARRRDKWQRLASESTDRRAARHARGVAEAEESRRTLWTNLEAFLGALAANAAAAPPRAAAPPPVALYDSETGRHIMNAPRGALIDCSGRGENDGAVRFWREHCDLVVPIRDVIRMLQSTGAWTNEELEELAVDEPIELLGRALWILANNWRDAETEAGNPEVTA